MHPINESLLSITTLQEAEAHVRRFIGTPDELGTWLFLMTVDDLWERASKSL